MVGHHHLVLVRPKIRSRVAMESAVTQPTTPAELYHPESKIPSLGIRGREVDDLVETQTLAIQVRRRSLYSAALLPVPGTF